MSDPLALYVSSVATNSPVVLDSSNSRGVKSNSLVSVEQMYSGTSK